MGREDIKESDMNPLTDLILQPQATKSLQASKWLDLQLLISQQEMEALFEDLGPFYIYQIGRVCPLKEGEISKQQFVEIYGAYIEELKQGKIPDEKVYRSFFASVFTVDRNHLFQALIPGNRRIIRASKPVVQLQMNKMGYSAIDGKFRGVLFGTNGISWGLHFSYPQLYRDEATLEVYQVKETDQFPNTKLFAALKRWVRKNTVPTPFLVDGVKKNATFRLGKECFSWINSHPELLEQNLKVETRVVCKTYRMT